jgi:AhpD family alkylhydroperoxidase
MTVTPKEKEVAAVGISVAAGCKPCTDHHISVARKARATDEAIRQAVTDAFAVRNKAAEIMKLYALSHLGDAAEIGSVDDGGGENRTGLLVRVGAAFAVNCVSSLEYYLAAAERAGIPQEAISQIINLAVLIKGRAASHADNLVGITEEEVT